MLPADTERLTFRQMTDSDVGAVGLLQLGGSSTPQRWIDWNRRNYLKHGFGLWIIQTHDGLVVGDCGLTVQEVDGKHLVESGWHVRAELQGLGYATEAAEAVRDAARDGGVRHLVALIRPHNVASQRVATKIAMTLEREVLKSGRVLVFGIDLSD